MPLSRLIGVECTQLYRICGQIPRTAILGRSCLRFRYCFFGVQFEWALRINTHALESSGAPCRMACPVCQLPSQSATCTAPTPGKRTGEARRAEQNPRPALERSRRHGRTSCAFSPTRAAVTLSPRPIRKGRYTPKFGDKKKILGKSIF